PTRRRSRGDRAGRAARCGSTRAAACASAPGRANARSPRPGTTRRWRWRCSSRSRPAGSMDRDGSRSGSGWRCGTWRVPLDTATIADRRVPDLSRARRCRKSPIAGWALSAWGGLPARSPRSCGAGSPAGWLPAAAPGTGPRCTLAGDGHRPQATGPATSVCGRLRRGYGEHSFQRLLGLALAIEQQGVVGPVGDRVAVLPGHAVLHAPHRYTVQPVAPAVEDAEQLGIAVGQLLLHRGREAVAVGIEEGLEFGQLELRMGHALADDLAFLGQRQHVDVEFGDHHLHPERGVGIDRGLDMRGGRVVEAPVALDADAVDADAVLLQHPDHAHDAIALFRAPGVEVVVVQLGIR